jgi:hypothetical protein
MAVDETWQEDAGAMLTQAQLRQYAITVMVAKRPLNSSAKVLEGYTEWSGAKRAMRINISLGCDI